MNLAKTRNRLAGAVYGIDKVRYGYDYAPSAPAAGDAWPILRRVEPSTFATCVATFDVVVVLAGDEESASAAFDDLAVLVIDALGKAGHNPQSVTPQIIQANGADLYVLAATVLCEVEP